MITRDEYNRRNGIEKNAEDRGECRSAGLTAGKPPSEAPPTAVNLVRALQRRHDRMRDLLDEITVMFLIGENRQELEQTGSTGKAVLHEMDRFRAIYEDLDK